MKKAFLSIIFVSVFGFMSAQTDTTVTLKDYNITLSEKDGKVTVTVTNPNLDSAENTLFKGIYGENNSTEANFGFPFSKFIKKLHKSKKLRPHDGGFALGFHNLASRDLSHIGTAQDAELRTSSFELQFKLCGLSLPLSKKYGWLFFSGLGIRHAQYHSDFNTTFHKVNNATVQVEAPGGILYKKTRIQTWAVTIPLMFEWQKKVGKRPIYVQGGVEAAVLFYAASKVKFDDGLHRRTQKKYEYGMNINPLQVDAKIGIGYGHVGLYVRYGLLSLFRSGRGPEVVPAAVGVVWNW